LPVFVMDPAPALRSDPGAARFTDQQGSLLDVSPAPCLCGTMIMGHEITGRALRGIKVNALRCPQMGKRPIPRRQPPGSPPAPPKDPGPPPAGPPLPLRHRLHELAGVELWHTEEPKTQGQRVSPIRYLVKHGDSEATFNRPHEA
jgi:hypothetical protein